MGAQHPQLQKFPGDTGRRPPEPGLPSLNRPLPFGKRPKPLQLMQASQSLPDPPSGASANPFPGPSPWEMPGPSLHLHHLPLTLLDWQLPHFTDKEAEAQENLRAQGDVGYKLQGQDPTVFAP